MSKRATQIDALDILQTSVFVHFSLLISPKEADYMIYPNREICSHTFAASLTFVISSLGCFTPVTLTYSKLLTSTKSSSFICKHDPSEKFTRKIKVRSLSRSR